MRLTKRDCEVIWLYEEPDAEDVYKKLKEYEDAEENGELIRVKNDSMSNVRCSECSRSRTSTGGSIVTTAYNPESYAENGVRLQNKRNVCTTTWKCSNCGEIMKQKSKTSFDLADRMKRYESVSKNYLTRRVPVIIRLDGKAFHSFTKGMVKPFDNILVDCMQETMKYLCQNIQGAVLGYTQSDEITIVVTDYKTLTTDAWFGYNVQKMTSISASMATFKFNEVLRDIIYERQKYEYSISNLEVYKAALEKGAMFDSRVFNIPVEEVSNCLIWRQKDATRNSIQSVGQFYFSQHTLHGKSCSDIQNMLMEEKSINWNDTPTHLKRGSCCIQKPRVHIDFNAMTGKDVEVIRTEWIIDEHIPIFTKDKSYIESLVMDVEEEE